MRSRDKRKTIVMIERLRDVLPESVSRTSGRYPPPTSIIRITPKQITHGPLMRHLLYPIQRADIVQRINTRTQPTVQAEDLVLNQCSEGQEIEQVGEELPDVGVAVFAEALVVEAVDLGDLAGFVVAAEDGDA